MRPLAGLVLALTLGACSAENWNAWSGPCTTNEECVINYRTCSRETSGQVAVLATEELAMRQAMCPSCPTLTCVGQLAICSYDPHAVAVCDQGRCARFVTTEAGGSGGFSRCDDASDCVAHYRCGRFGLADCPGAGGASTWYAPIRRDHVAAYEEVAGCTGLAEDIGVQCVANQCELARSP